MRFRSEERGVSLKAEQPLLRLFLTLNLAHASGIQPLRIHPPFFPWHNTPDVQGPWVRLSQLGLPLTSNCHSPQSHASRPHAL